MLNCSNKLVHLDPVQGESMTSRMGEQDSQYRGKGVDWSKGFDD